MDDKKNSTAPEQPEVEAEQSQAAIEPSTVASVLTAALSSGLISVNERALAQVAGNSEVAMLAAAISAQTVSYAKHTWADGESGGTPITAAKLNEIETFLDSIKTQHNNLVSDTQGIRDLVGQIGIGYFTFRSSESVSVPANSTKSINIAIGDTEDYEPVAIVGASTMNASVLLQGFRMQNPDNPVIEVRNVTDSATTITPLIQVIAFRA